MPEIKKKSIAVNTIYTILGALVLNGVLQLLIYPRINSELGADANGEVLYLMAFVNILGPSIGQAMNNSRLVLRREYKIENGDYDRPIMLFSLIGAAITAAACAGTIRNGSSFGNAISRVVAAVLLILLVTFTVYRYYGDVEYRMSLRYRKYFIYYAVCSIGYIAGYGLYRLTGEWLLIFLTGEAAALVYVYVTGRIFRPFWKQSDASGTVFIRGSVLTASYLVTNITLNIDRLYLNNSLGGEAVTCYYVASLIGKTLVLFVAPVNTIIISYLTREKKHINGKQFAKLASAGVLVSAVFFVLCEAVNPIFIRLFYPELTEKVRGILTVVNLTQILAMLSAYLFVVVLTFTNERWQLILQLCHLGVLVVLMILMTGSGGLEGFSRAVLIANSLRIAAVLVLGCISLAEQRQHSQSL